MFERTKDRIRKPAAVVSASLAALALSGCRGGGDETIDFNVLCKNPNQSLQVVEVTQPSYAVEGKLSIACEDKQGITRPVNSIQLTKLAGGEASNANYHLEVEVNEEGDRVFSTNTKVNYNVAGDPAFEDYSTIEFVNVDEIKEVKITEIDQAK